MSNWYLIHTKSKAEFMAEAHLERQGYEVYLPRLAQVVRCRGKWRERIVALFPRYLFLRLVESSQALGPVRSTVGVSSIVRFGLQYAKVPGQLVLALRARADSESGLHRLVLSSRLEPGLAVKISEGPFGGLEGVFESKSGSDRVVVLVSLLGRETRVQLSSQSLVPGVAA